MSARRSVSSNSSHVVSSTLPLPRMDANADENKDRVRPVRSRTDAFSSSLDSTVLSNSTVLSDSTVPTGGVGDDDSSESAIRVESTGAVAEGTDSSDLLRER